MSSEAMKAVFNNMTSGASRRAELEYRADSAAHREADSIEEECTVNKAEHTDAHHGPG